MVIVLAVLSNIIPDYLSIFETRYIIHKYSASQWVPLNYSSLFILILLDAFLTMLLLLVWWLLIYMLFVDDWAINEFLRAIYYSIKATIQINFTETFNSTFYLEDQLYFDFFVASSIITTFYTSFWAWLYIITVLIMKLSQSYLSPLWLYITKRFLNVEEKPFIASAWISGAVTTIIGLLVITFTHIT